MRIKYNNKKSIERTFVSKDDFGMSPGSVLKIMFTSKIDMNGSINCFECIDDVGLYSCYNKNIKRTKSYYHDKNVNVHKQEAGLNSRVQVMIISKDKKFVLVAFDSGTICLFYERCVYPCYEIHHANPIIDIQWLDNV
eukprot:UN34314